MTGSLSFIPTSLPPGLYQQASGAPPAAASAILSHSTGGSNSNFTPSPVTSSFPHRVQTHNTGQPLQPQYSGYNKPTPPQLPVRPSAGSPFGASAFAQPQPPAQWDVTPTEKASSDNFFNSLDSGRRGYIEGDVAVPFMLDSKLPEDDLALIWLVLFSSTFCFPSLPSHRDLADLNNDGRLTKDGFAVAMHLIQNKLKGVPIPSSLPPTLVPPSLRQSPFSPPATQTTHQQPPASDLQDLLWDEPVQAPVPAQTTGNALSNIPAQTTGGAASMLSHQSTGGAMNVLAPQTTGPMSRQLTGQAPSPQPGSQFTSPAPRQDPFGSSYTTRTSPALKSLLSKTA
jgi:epidermal growth factor receptor substrate 15